MKHLIFILIPALLLSCKSPQKTVTELKQQNDVAINNDIAVTDDKHLAELTERILQRIINERLNIDIKQTKYDTDKPADPVTGKHPVKEENDINIKKEKDQKETETNYQEKDSTSSVQTIDKSQLTDRTKAEIKHTDEVKGTGWKKGLMVAIVMMAALLFIIYKARKKWQQLQNIKKL
jgi:hypothetical protein